MFRSRRMGRCSPMRRVQWGLTSVSDSDWGQVQALSYLGEGDELYLLLKVSYEHTMKIWKMLLQCSTKLQKILQSRSCKFGEVLIMQRRHEIALNLQKSNCPSFRSFKKLSKFRSLFETTPFVKDK